MTTSLRRKSKRKLLRMARNIEDNNLPQNCFICKKDLSSSIHHFFCDKCWNKVQEKIKNLRREEALKWCLVCGKNISDSPYLYFCETHGKEMEKYRAKTLARKKISVNKGTNDALSFLTFTPQKDKIN